MIRAGGLGRALALGMLAHGVLKHQLLAIDVKVKWTLKQSTVAAVFIAVLFIVSEGAAALVEAQTGSTVAGMLAAGALVFAIGPVQRLAEKVANNAMPGVKAVGEMSQDERARIHLETARHAWADGALSLDERALLDKLGAQLGLGAEEAADPERSAAAAASGGSPGWHLAATR